MSKKILLIVPFVLLLLTGCRNISDVKDSFCGIHINYQYCKCAFHNEYCGAIGMSKGEAKNHVYDKYDEWKEKNSEKPEVKKEENDDEDDIDNEEIEAICKYDSDCDPICEGDIKWKMGCNPRENACEKTFDTDCSSEKETFGELSFSKTCQSGECVRDEDTLSKKREELEGIKKEMSDELKSLNATRDDLKNVMMDANKNCLNGLADMTNVAILEFSTRIASLVAGGLPGLADVTVDYVNDAINKLSAYANPPEKTEEPSLKPHEYIKLNCDLYHHFIASLAATDKELEDVLEKANQADAKLQLLP